MDFLPIMVYTVLYKETTMTRRNLHTGAALAIMAALFVFAGTGAFALDVTGDAPTVTGTGAGLLSGAIGTAWSTALGQLNTNVQNINDPKKLIKAFGTSSVYASQGATQRGYGEPKRFTFTIGPMVGLKIGAGLGELGSYFTDIGNEFQKEGDATLGLNVQGISGQFNLNTGIFLPFEGLDLGLRFGYFKLPDGLLEGFAFDTFSIGLVGNYQILKEKTLVPVVLKWRGLSLGTGVIFQNTNISYSMKIDSITQPIGSVDLTSIGLGNPNLGNIKIDPKLVFDMKTFTVTVPVEATTAIQLFSFLNLTLGVGADLGFGKNEMKLGLDADVNLEGLPGGITQDKAGSLGVSGGGDMAPEFFNFKIMTGLGFKIGPVILDVPVTLYPGKETGASIGVTLGFTL
jgi:hypothetical protein